MTLMGLKLDLWLILAILGGIEIIIAFLLSIVLVKIRGVNVKSDLFFSGKNGKSLEEIIKNNQKSLALLDQEIQELYNISNQINSLALRSIHKIGIVRFNPFKDIGGDQSFSLAFLDGKNNGITITSLHTKGGTRVYMKPVKRGKAEKYPLTTEEEKAIIEAQEKKNILNE